MQICVDAGGGRSQKREISAEYVRFSNRAIVSIRQPGKLCPMRGLPFRFFVSLLKKVRAGLLAGSKAFLSEMMKNMAA